MSALSLKEKIFLISCVVLIMICGLTLNSCHQYQNKYNQSILLRDTMMNKMKSYIDENGALHAQVEVLKIDPSVYRDMNRKQLDSFAKSVNSQIKSFQNILSLNTTTTGNIKTRIDTIYTIQKPYIVTIPGGIQRITDTIKNYRVKYNDQWMDLNGIIDGNSFTADYKVKGDLTFITHTKRTGFLGLGKKKTLLDVQTSNPNVSFSNMQDIDLKKVKPKHWSIGPYLGYGYNGLKFEPNIGISIQRSLIKF